jgi:MscS family membrane protein
MNTLADRFGLAFLAEPWLPQVLTVIVVIAALNIGVYYLLRRIEKITEHTAPVWDDALIQALRKPLTLMLWVVGIAFAAEIVHKHTGAPIFDFVVPTRNVVVMFSLAWFLLRLIRNVANNIVATRQAAGETVDHTTVDALSKLGRFSVIIIAALVILQTLGFSITGLLTFGGIGGIAVGFAAKDILANFFGGLTIYLDRPFAVGEWIRSPDKEIEGTVEYIGWRHTRVRAFNKNPIYVPNALFTTIVVENPTRMTNRRIKETIGIRYADLDKMAAIVGDVRTMLENHPEIDAGTTLIVNFNQFAASSLDFFIYTFTKTKEWVHYHAVKQDVLLRTAAIIARHGAEIAYPTQTLHIETQPSDPATPGVSLTP